MRDPVDVGDEELEQYVGSVQSQATGQSLLLFVVLALIIFCQILFLVSGNHFQM
jgi:hypothetical protein